MASFFDDDVSGVAPEPGAAPQAAQPVEKEGVSLTKDVAKGAFVGTAQIVPEIIDTVSAIANFAESFTGLEEVVKENAPEDSFFSENGLFPDKLDLSSQAKAGAQSLVGAPETGAGKFAEGAFRFGGSFLAAGPILKGVGLGVKATQTAQLLKAGSKAKSLLAIAKAGVGRGALADFIAVNEKDDLLVEMGASFSPVIQDHLSEFVDDENYSKALLKKKLLSIPEGILIGAGLNGISKIGSVLKTKVVDNIVAIFERARTNGVKETLREGFSPSAGKLSVEESLLSRGLLPESKEFKKAVAEADGLLAKIKALQEAPEDLTGKVFQGEKLARVGKEGDEFAKASNISKDGTAKIKLETDDLIITNKVLESLSDNEKLILETLVSTKKGDKTVLTKVLQNKLTSQKVLDNLDKGILPNVDQLSAVGKTIRLLSDTPANLKKTFDKISPEFKITPENGKTGTFSLADADEMFRVHAIAPELVETLIASKRVSAQGMQLFGQKLSIVKSEMSAYGKVFQKNPNDFEAAFDFLRSEEAYTSMVREFNEQGSVAGQSLRHFGLIKENLKNSFRSNIVRKYLQNSDVKKALKKLDVLQELIADQTLDTNAKRYLRSSKVTKVLEGLYATRVSNLLVGERTQRKNIVSGFLQHVHSTAARGLMAVGSKNAHTRQAAQAYLKTIVTRDTYKRAAFAGMEAFRNGRIPQHLVEEGGSSSVKSLGHYDVFKEAAKANKGSDNMVDMLVHNGSTAASAVNKIPSRLLAAPDAFYKQVKFDATLAENVVNNSLLVNKKQTFEEAMVSAREVLSLGGESGSLMSKYVSDANVDGLLRQVEETTFTQAPNAAMRLVSDIKNYGGVYNPLKWMFPFSTIQLNMVRWTANNMPFIAKHTKAGDILKAGGLAAEVKQAEIYVTGLTILGSMALLGEYMTGGAPVNRNEKKQQRKLGFKPYSLKLAGGNLDLKEYGAFGGVLTHGKVLAEIAETLDDSDVDFQEKSSELIVAAAVLAQEVFVPGFITDSSFGVGEFINIISSGGEDGEVRDKLSGFLGGVVGEGLVPGTGLFTRNKHLFGDGTIKEPDYSKSAFMIGFKRALPWLDTDLRPSVDILGEDRKSDLLSGVPKNQVVVEELDRLTDQGFSEDPDPDGVRASRFLTPVRRTVTKTILGEQVNVVRLSNAMYWEYQKAAAGTLEGYEGPYGDLSFAQKLEEQILNGYDEAVFPDSDEGKIMYMKKVHKQFKDAAKDYILLQDEVLDGKQEGIERTTEKREKLLKIR